MNPLTFIRPRTVHQLTPRKTSRSVPTGFSNRSVGLSRHRSSRRSSVRETASNEANTPSSSIFQDDIAQQSHDLKKAQRIKEKIENLLYIGIVCAVTGGMLGALAGTVVLLGYTQAHQLTSNPGFVWGGLIGFAPGVLMLFAGGLRRIFYSDVFHIVRKNKEFESTFYPELEKSKITLESLITFYKGWEKKNTKIETYAMRVFREISFGKWQLRGQFVFSDNLDIDNLMRRAKLAIELIQLAQRVSNLANGLRNRGGPFRELADSLMLLLEETQKEPFWAQKQTTKNRIEIVVEMNQDIDRRLQAAGFDG